MSERDLSQSELARRVHVSQQSISRLLSGETQGSKHLHRIARELGTTPAYLMGDTDDPGADLPAVPDLKADTRELVDHFEGLSAADRRALLQVARAMKAGPPAGGTLHEPDAEDFKLSKEGKGD
jgi:transcriptional regulator with XRE-family HTH domain